MRIHRRTEWTEPGYPVTGPKPYVPKRVYVGVAHYTADDKIEYPIDDYLRRMQRSYVNSRGYSVGYSFAIDQQGEVWEIRGFDYQPAANNGDFGEYEDINFNMYSFPVLFLVDGNGRLSDAAAAAGRELYAHAYEVTKMEGGDWRSFTPQPHSDSDWTACPGDGIKRDIVEGRLTFDPTEQPEAPVDPYPMFVKHNDHDAVYIVWPGFKTWVPDGATMKVLRDRYNFRDPVRSLDTATMQSYGPVVGPLFDADEIDEYGVPF